MTRDEAIKLLDKHWKNHPPIHLSERASDGSTRAVEKWIIDAVLEASGMNPEWPKETGTPG